MVKARSSAIESPAQMAYPTSLVSGKHIGHYLPETDLMVGHNVSETCYTHHTYTGMIAIPPLQRTSNTRLASIIGSMLGSIGPVTLFPCSSMAISVSECLLSSETILRRQVHAIRSVRYMERCGNEL